MSEFSPDGQWWWDGDRWTPITSVVLPDSLFAGTYQSHTYLEANRQAGSAQNLLVAMYLLTLTAVGIVIAIALVVPRAILVWRSLKSYRLWSLEQIALATSYLLGSSEPMLVGDADLRFTGLIFSQPTRRLGVAVTGHHVLLYQFDSLIGPPRLILAARAADVTVYVRYTWYGGTRLGVARFDGYRELYGYPLLMRPAAVVAAWMQSRQGAPQK